MKIGIIGAGNIGTGVGKHLAAKGHEIMVSYARTSEKVEAAAKVIAVGARAGSPEDAAEYGEVVIIATPWTATLEIVKRLADRLGGKILWDTTCPLKPDMSGLSIGTTSSAGEEIAKAAPAARVVKAIPPFAEVLHSPSNVIADRVPGVFACSDDAEARAIVLKLVGDINADGVDAGPLALARYTEPLGMLLVQLAYMQGFGPRIGSLLLRETKG